MSSALPGRLTGMATIQTIYLRRPTSTAFWLLLPVRSSARPRAYGCRRKGTVDLFLTVGDSELGLVVDDKANAETSPQRIALSVEVPDVDDALTRVESGGAAP